MKLKSFSCSHLRKELHQQYSATKNTQPAKNQFVPFLSQRRLGKLITHSDVPQPSAKRPTDEELISKISFKNFQQIYKTVMQYQNKRYSELTRKPDQRDLINKEWRINDLSKLSKTKKEQKCTHKIYSSRQKSSKQVARQTSRFPKMDQFLFRKMSLVKQPQDNPQFHDMYNNYIEICEMNQNIKRKQLASKQKDKVIRL